MLYILNLKEKTKIIYEFRYNTSIFHKLLRLLLIEKNLKIKFFDNISKVKHVAINNALNYYLASKFDISKSLMYTC